MDQNISVGKQQESEKVYLNSIEINSLTGLYFSHAFFNKADEFLKQVNPNAEVYCMVAMDLEHFRLFNKLYGREQGDKLLINLAELLEEYRQANGGVVGYLGGDNFGMLTCYKKDTLKQFRRDAGSVVKEWSNAVGFLPAFGIYPISDISIPAATMYDRATLAMNHVIGNYARRSCEYSQDMEEQVEEELRILEEVEEALDNEEFTFFVQPQCDISTGKIVGGESLVRWRHPTKGLIPPGVFIPILEKNGLIANLDRYVWRKVCQWLREWMDKGFQPVPISVNVSRIDIFSMDVPAYLSELINTYNLPPKLLKVEITESAYAESNDKIIRTVKQLRNEDFLVMMDDFGSGYSSLNMLKSVAVDVLKIDMRFLDINENEEEKGIGILESVVNMARQMFMPIIVEGVETRTQEKYLLKMGCRYSQGYYYYKPMPVEEFEKLISNIHNVDFEGMWYKQVESLRLRELLDQNLFSDTMINNMLGPSAFYDMYENRIEITRVNEQYFRLAGVSSQETADNNKKFWIHAQGEERRELFDIFMQAYENQAGGAQGYIRFMRADGVLLKILLRLFFLREREGHKLFYGSLTEIGPIEEKEREPEVLEQKVDELTEKQFKHMEKYYGNMKAAMSVVKISLDADGKPEDYKIVYDNRKVDVICGGNIERAHFLASRTFKNKMDELLHIIYLAAYQGEQSTLSTYSPIAGKYLKFTFTPFQYGYATCMLEDINRRQIYETSMEKILISYREVYYIHLQDNYCHMLYPDENHLMEKDNYEEYVNRQYRIGRILPHDEENVRKFLSLENLQKVLSDQDTVEYKYRRSVDGVGEEWCMNTINVCERVDGVPKTAVMTIRSIEALMREQEEWKEQHMTEMLMHMAEGFLVYRATGDEKILYANPTVLKMFGCDTMEEFKELVQDSFRGMVHPEDYERINREIWEQVKQSERKMDFISYRIIRKDGEIRWIKDCGHLENSGIREEDRVFYVFISDVTDSISQQEKDKCVELSMMYNQQKENAE